MVSLDRPAKNDLNRVARKIYNPIGFARFYNFVLWFILSGALFGFLLARAAYMNFNGIYCGGDPQYGAAPGECVSYTCRGPCKFGIIMHLCTIISAGFLVLFQFIPAIRHKAILFHLVNGYAVIILVLFSNSGALMIARVAFGGTLDTELGVGVLAIVTTVSLFLAWVNIKRLQIEQHRKWVLRARFYLAAIITERLIFLAAQPIIRSIGDYYFAMPCHKVVRTMASYGIPAQAITGLCPGCIPYLNGTSPNQNVVVHADQIGTPKK